MKNELTLLLVDDEQNITKSIKRACRQRDYQVFVASSGAEALEILSKESIQVILSDQMMPEMTGAELFEQVTELYPDSVRILLTGHTALEGITRAVNQGAVFKIMFKPWEDDELLHTLDEAFRFYHINEQNKQLTKELKLLNRELEVKVEEKTHCLRLHVEQLRLAHKLFDHMPSAAIGISDELLIVDANQAAIKMFMPQPLIAKKAIDVLPDTLMGLIQTCLTEGCESDCIEQHQHLVVQDVSYKFVCRIVRISETQQAILLFGSPLL